MAAIDRLLQLHRDQASGEFICATMEVEVHVYLQRGRVAWATSSEARTTFRDYLERECQVDAARLAAAIESARRRLVNLRAALVEDGVATVEQVRLAVKAQVAAAVRDTQRAEPFQVVFLPREAGFAGHDPELTFDLPELLAPSADAPGASVAEVGEKVLAALPQLQWLATVQGGQVSGWPPVSVPSAVGAWHAATIGTGAGQVLLRDAGALVLGARLAGPGASLWGRVDHLGQQRAVEVFSLQAQRSPARARPASRAVGPLLALGPAPAGEASLKQLVEVDGEVEALALVAPSAEPFVLGRGSQAVSHWRSQLRTRARIFEVGGLAPRTDDARLPVLALEDEAGWWYATPLPGGSRTCLWVLAQPGLSTGMGFAMARSLARRAAAVGATTLAAAAPAPTPPLTPPPARAPAPAPAPAAQPGGSAGAEPASASA